MSRRSNFDPSMTGAEAPKIRRRAVESSAIRSIGYDRRTGTLEIAFHSGRIYDYSGVSNQRARAFNQAGSKGKYFNKSIRDNYGFKRIG